MSSRILRVGLRRRCYIDIVSFQWVIESILWINRLRVTGTSREVHENLINCLQGRLNDRNVPQMPQTTGIPGRILSLNIMCTELLT